VTADASFYNAISASPCRGLAASLPRLIGLSQATLMVLDDFPKRERVMQLGVSD
jgi:hypothetical protein